MDVTAVMKPEIAENEIKIPESISEHIIGWKIQRIGWIFFALLLLAGLIGLFGDGPLSFRTLTSQSDSLQYEKFIRYETTTHLTFSTYSQQTATISLDAGYLKNFDIDNISPQPLTTKLLNGQMIFEFDVSGAAKIKFAIIPNTYGKVAGKAVVRNKTFLLSQFIYP